MGIVVETWLQWKHMRSREHSTVHPRGTQNRPCSAPEKVADRMQSGPGPPETPNYRSISMLLTNLHNIICVCCSNSASFNVFFGIWLSFIYTSLEIIQTILKILYKRRDITGGSHVCFATRTQTLKLEK